MSGPDTLQKHTEKFITNVGGAFVGERAVFRGKDIHEDLMHMNFMMLTTFGITGKPWTPEQVKLWDAFFVMTSYPDARIWNNRVAALAGTTRSTPAAAMSAATAISEATIYGRQNEAKVIYFLTRTYKYLQEGIDLDECIKLQYDREKKYPGYGRPIAANDERIGPAMKLAEELGFHEGPHVKLAFEIEQRLLASKGLKMNFGALVSAFAADFGMSPTEFSLFLFPAFSAGMHPCYLEALEKPAGALFPVSCENVKYTGVENRSWNVEK